MNLNNVVMNWYHKFLKFAIKGTYTILAGQMAKETVSIVNTLISNDDIGNGPVARDIYCPTLKKNIRLEINLEEYHTLNRDFAMGGDYGNEPTIDPKTNLVTDLGKETVFVNIYIKPNFHIDRNQIYQEAFLTIRHELEHSRDYAENKISQEEIEKREKFRLLLKSRLASENIIERYSAMVDYCLYSPEFQSVVRSIATSAKKSGQNFEQLLKEKVYALLYSNDAGSKNNIIKEFGNKKVIETENKIINNYKHIQSDIFRRTKTNIT
jgi:hypothetical protein